MPPKSNISTKSQKMPAKLRLKLANECLDILGRTKLKCSDKKYKFYLLHSKDIDVTTFDRLMILMKLLMEDMYKSSTWGWNETEKLAEWKHSRTKIMIVTKNDQCDPLKLMTEHQLPSEDEDIIGFMCLRFEVGSDKSECALYVYELHVDPDYQRQGLGQELMKMAKVIGTEFKMDKIMLTSFRFNLEALKFYQKLNYITDKSSPAINEADYIILSSKLKYQN